LPSIAAGIGAGASYGLVAAFWLVGAGAMATYTWRGGAEGARRSLEDLAPPRTAPAQLRPRKHPGTEGATPGAGRGKRSRGHRVHSERPAVRVCATQSSTSISGSTYVWKASWHAAVLSVGALVTLGKPGKGPLPFPPCRRINFPPRPPAWTAPSAVPTATRMFPTPPCSSCWRCARLPGLAWDQAAAAMPGQDCDTGAAVARGAQGTGRWWRPRQARRGGPGMCESGLVTRLQGSVQHVANPPPSAGRLARDRPTCYPHPDDLLCRLLRDGRHRPGRVHARWASPHEVAPDSAGASQGRRRHHEQDPLVGR